MNYKLCAELLNKYSDDKVRELISYYEYAENNIRYYESLVAELNHTIMILEAENKFLKEDLEL